MKPMNRSQQRRDNRLQAQTRRQKASSPHLLSRASCWFGLGGLSIALTILGGAPAALAAGEIQIVTTFDPIILDQGSEGKLRYIIRNNEASALSNASLTKALPQGFELNVAQLGTAINTCNLDISTSTATSLRITGGTLPPINTAVSPPVPGRCDLELPIIGKKTPNPDVIFNIAVGEFSAGSFSNTELSPGRVTIRQLGNLSPTMTFGPTTLPSRGRTRFTLGLNNSTGKILTGASFTNGFTIPAGFTLVAGSTTNTCGATLDPAGLAATPPVIKLLSSTIPASGCSFSFEFEGPEVTGEQTFGPISWAAEDMVTDLEVSNNAGTSNSGTIEGGIKIQQSFSLNPVYINEDSTMTIRIRNANATAITGETLDSIISNASGTANIQRLQLGGSGNDGDVTSNCPTTPTVAYDNTTGRLSLTNLSVPASVLTPAASTAVGECTITLQMVGTHDSANAVPTFTSIGSYTSTIATGQLTAQGMATSNQLAVENAGLTIQDLGGSGPGVGVGIGIRTQYSSNGVDFGTARVAASNRGVMRIWLDNNAGEALTGVAINNNPSGNGIQLPANLRIADTGARGTNCGASAVITAPANGSNVTMTGGSIGRRSSCYIDINVVSDNFNLTPGYDATAAEGVMSTNTVTGQNGRSYTNAAKAVGGNYLEVNDFLTVYPSFATSVVAPNADARMRLSLRNAQAAAKTGARLRYRLPFAIAAVPDYEASAACGIGPGDFTIEGSAPNQDLVINALNIPASTGSKAPATPIEYGDTKDGECLLSFDVQAPATPGGPYTAAVAPGTLTDSTGTQQNRRQETASFRVQALSLNLSQRFTSFANPDTTITELVGAEPAYLEVSLTNPTSNPLPLTNITLNDVLEQAEALTYPGARTTTTCTGAAGPAIATIAPDGRSFRLTGADLPVGASCILRVPVTTLNVSLLANDIPIESAISAEGAKSNGDGDSITTSANIALVKDFETPTTTPDGTAAIVTDGIARLNLTVLNATTRGYNDLSVVDNLPTGLQVAPNPNIVSNCGTVSAPAGSTTIRLSNGAVLANAPCKISVNVTSLVPSPVAGYENVIPIGGLTAGAFRNSKPATARLVVTGTLVERPGLRLVKRATAITSIDRPGDPAQTVNLNNVVDDASNFDNAPGWPAPIDAASGISSYLRGAFDTSQLPGIANPLLRSGTEIEYTGYYLSNGTVSANGVQLCDYIPANTTYVPNSMVLVRGDGTSVPVSDAIDTDGGFYATGGSAQPGCKGTDTGKGAIVVNLGNLPNTGPSSYGRVFFRVKVD